MAHLIEVFVRRGCLSSPEASAAVHRFARRRQDVTVMERDIDRDRQAAARYRLFATPAIVVDGRPVAYGVPSDERLARWCDAGPARPSCTERA